MKPKSFPIAVGLVCVLLAVGGAAFAQPENQAQAPNAVHPDSAKADAKAAMRREAARLRRQAQDMRRQAEDLRNEARQVSANLANITTQSEREMQEGRIEMLLESAENLEDAAGNLAETADELEGSQSSLRLRAAGKGLTFTLPGGAETRLLRGDSLAARNNISIGLLNLDLGISAFVNEASLNMPQRYHAFEQNYARSVNVNLEFFPTAINLANHQFHLLTAVGLDLPKYEFLRDTRLEPGSDPLAWSDSDKSLRKNSLKMTYLRIPVALRFSTDCAEPEKGFRVTLGGYASLLISSHVKFRAHDAGRPTKVHDLYNLNRMQYGVVGRIGFKFIELYCQYALSPLFMDVPANPDLNTVVMGIRVVSI